MNACNLWAVAECYSYFVKDRMWILEFKFCLLERIIQKQSFKGILRQILLLGRFHPRAKFEVTSSKNLFSRIILMKMYFGLRVCKLESQRLSYTLFSNSLVRARPALSRKILSLWMARAKIARAWPALFWCCFYQHQSSARPAPGADQRVSERSSTKFRPKFRLHGQMPHNSRAAWPSRLFLSWNCSVIIWLFFHCYFSFKQNVLH